MKNAMNFYGGIGILYWLHAYNNSVNHYGRGLDEDDASYNAQPAQTTILTRLHSPFGGSADDGVLHDGGGHGSHAGFAQ